MAGPRGEGKPTEDRSYRRGGDGDKKTETGPGGASIEFVSELVNWFVYCSRSWYTIFNKNDSIVFSVEVLDVVVEQLHHQHKQNNFISYILLMFFKTCESIEFIKVEKYWNSNI